ncbi:hypothetical protein PInf_018518 [Phytophthora infestans]|nr:hypothetical protein PInf_018518 [Phytophthora infestans]
MASGGSLDLRDTRAPSNMAQVTCTAIDRSGNKNCKDIATVQLIDNGDKVLNGAHRSLRAHIATLHAKGMLAEALAFIDESQSRLGNRRARIKPNIKRVIDYQCYSTQLQHRKKAELRALREQALELDEQVKLLLQRRQQRQRSRTEKEKNSTTQNEDDDSREWLKKAVGEFQKRQKAERTHRKLQEIWANQTKVNGAFRHLVQRRSLPNGKDFVLEDKENTPLEPSVADETMNIISQLEKRVERLYLSSDSVFPPDLPETISCNTRVKRSSDTAGNCIEIITTTPVSSPLHVAADVVWKDLNVKSQDPERIYSFIRGRNSDSLEKNFLIAYHNPSGVLKIDGFQFMRKFEESDRVVVIKHNILTLPHMGLEFRDRCWIIISRSKSDPTQASVARTCYQLYAEGSESFSSNEDVAHTRDYIMWETWTMEDARDALNSMWDRFGDDFAASGTEYMHVSEIGMHWETIAVAKRDAKTKCNFCDTAKKAIREYRKEANTLMDEFTRVLKSKQVEWRAEGLDDDEMHERRSLLKADMFLEDSYPDPNAAESTADDILAHICEHDKFPVVPFEGMANGLERRNDDIFNALALECQDLCDSFYRPLKQNLAAVVAFTGQRVHRPWMDTGEEAGIIRRELIAGLSNNGFLVGVYVMKAVED